MLNEVADMLKEPVKSSEGKEENMKSIASSESKAPESKPGSLQSQASPAKEQDVQVSGVEPLQDPDNTKSNNTPPPVLPTVEQNTMTVSE